MNICKKTNKTTKIDTCKRTAIVTNRTPVTGQNNTPMNKDKKLNCEKTAILPK